MDKIKAVLELFKTGSAVANPGLWKAGQISATLVGALFMALAHLYKAFTGHDFPMDENTADAIGGGLVALVNVVLTLVTSQHIGVNGLQPAGVSVPAAMPSPQAAPASASKAVPGLPVQGVDDATRQRALDFVRRAGNPADRDFQAP